MKKGKIIITFLLITLTLVFTACNREGNKDVGENSSIGSDDSTGEIESENSTSEGEEGIQTTYSDNIIRWGTICNISDEALSKFNKRLMDLGYDFSLKIVPLDFVDYQNEIINYEETNGPLDIAFTGLEFVGDGGNALNLIKSGYYTQLEEFLDSTDGRELLDIYDRKVWESAKVDGNIYTIPNGTSENQEIIFAFNKAYVNEEDIKDFTGDFFELKQYMDKTPFNEDFSHIVLGISDIDMFELIDCDFKEGLLFDRDEKKAYNPYEHDEYKKVCEVLSDYYKSKYINYNPSFLGESTSDEEIIDSATNYLKKGDFFVFIGRKSELSDINADLILYEKPAYIQTILSGNTGITANSKNKEEAFQLLSLAYTDEELANLLVYGVDGVDYKLEDGKAYTLDGEAYDSYTRQFPFGIYEMTYPTGDEDFETSRFIDKKEHYKNNVKSSPFIGFNFYSEEYMVTINKIDEMIYNSFNIWKSEDMDAEWDRTNEKLKEAGVDELVTAMNEALDEHFK